MKKVRSCIKWNGGKYSELDIIIENLPENIATYVEPFIGGGSVFWTLKNNCQIKFYHINDINAYLINFYKHLQSNYNELIELLKEHINTKQYYLNQRDIINQNKNPNTIELASIFYFINKTCFGGKWQVNKEGNMTNSHADYPNSRYRTWSQINPKYSTIIQDTKITNKDYMEVMNDYIDDELAFMFLDPPYTNLNNMYVDNVDFDKLYSNILFHLKNSKARILMILGDGELERDFFDSFISSDYEFNYEFNSTAKNNKRKHIIVKNY